MSNTRLGFRISCEDRKLLEQVCSARGEDLSDFLRRAVKKEFAYLGYYPDSVKQALGIKEGQ